ncbi:sulfurtransferase complex subunit TusB [Shewanella gelidimarina]|uniref:sulfurtransferase complex subunit TusB n=1 Tax=Shewanella gelidimarina TaxID=56813 RepID=UPI0020102142|nr:sulfurtransferase complex subunit TusB [Shewanella gelidimarina]MCL1060203.1 sulfurtransferase complex subunit TusB [Shewanella gelidimarina]
MILHHIQSSPMQSSALKTCLRYIDPSDTILLSGNAVNCLLTQEWQQRLSPYKLMLLADDVIARGLQARLSAYKHIDYSDFVEQTLTHKKVISW